jgi:hypothetical protein
MQTGSYFDHLDLLLAGVGDGVQEVQEASAVDDEAGREHEGNERYYDLVGPARVRRKKNKDA